MNSSFTQAMVEDQILGARTKIAACGIPQSDIVGFRQPFLESNPTVRQVSRVWVAALELMALLSGWYMQMVRPLEHPLTFAAACRPPSYRAAQVLKSNGFLYDSTILEEPTNSISNGMAARTWPYTLQDGVPQNCAW